MITQKHLHMRTVLFASLCLLRRLTWLFTEHVVSCIILEILHTGSPLHIAEEMHEYFFEVYHRNDNPLWVCVHVIAT